MTTVISVENLSKSYRLGQISGRTITEDLNRWWARVRSKPDPYLKVGQIDHGNRRGEHLWALKEVSFTVEQGDVLGIIGRNGAGKSTLLKILSRVTAPTAGQIRIRGHIASLLEVGTGFHPDLTGRENIFLNGSILGMRRQEIIRKFDEIIDFAEIDKFVDTPVKRYSSGMYVRLAFSVAASLEKDILVVDEVLAVGDIEFQKKCLGKMGDVAQLGRTVILVSHQMNQIRRLCGRTLWMNQGTIAGYGATAEVVAAYEAAMLTSRSIDGDRFADRAKFQSWRVDNQQGREKNVVNGDSAVTLLLCLSVGRPLKMCHHGIALLDQEGRVLWGWAADNLRFEPGIYELRYALPSLPIKPGVYTVKTSLYDESGIVDVWDWVPNLVIDTEFHTHKDDKWGGILNIPCNLDIRPVDSKSGDPAAIVGVQE